MGYDAINREFDNNRGAFITAGRHHMLHPVAMLHHRVSWSVLRSALNKVMHGTADTQVVNALLQLSPENCTELIKKFKAVLERVQAAKTLTVTELATLDKLEGEVFSFPCNLFLGLNARADDPADRMDFTPADVEYNGARASGVPGDLQKTRENVFGLLSIEKLSTKDIRSACSEWSKLWAAHGGGLSSATPFNAAWWAPGAAPFTAPAYRYWVHGGVALTATQSAALNDVIYKRALKLST